jgi:hypothetical protein
MVLLEAGVASGPQEAESSSNKGGFQEAPAPRCTEQHNGTGALEATDCIGEIFRVANLLLKNDRRFTPDEEAIYSAALDEFAARAFEGDPTWADNAPLFLQRREA